MFSQTNLAYPESQYIFFSRNIGHYHQKVKINLTLK